MNESKIKVHFICLGLLCAAVLWYLTASLVLMPRSEARLAKSIEGGDKVLGFCDEIYQLDPARLKFSESRKEIGKFQYTTAIDKLAVKNGIKAADYDIRTEAVIKRSNRTTQGATMTIKTIDMLRFTSFVTEFLETWPGLEVDSLRLMANDGDDDWKATLRFMHTEK